MRYKHIILSIFLALSFVACTSDTNDGTASTTTETNQTVVVVVDETNNTIDVNGSLSVNFAGASSSRELTVNNELTNIEVLVFGSDNAPYTGGTIFIAYPEKATTGVSVGSFSSLSAEVIDGKAVFNYTGPKDLQALVDNNDTSTVFGFYHSSDATSVKNFTFTYSPIADQIVLETYAIKSSLSDGNITLGLNSSKLVSFYVENDIGERVADSNVNSIVVEVLNEALVDLKDTLGNNGDKLTFTGDNDVSMSIDSNTTSGIVPIKITANVTDANDANITLSDVFNVVVLSGQATAMSISYAGTSNDSVNAKFKEKMIIAITDEYGNKVNTKPGLAVEVMSGYAEDKAGPLNYMYHKSIGTLEDTKFSTASGVITKIDMKTTGSNYSIAPTVSYPGGGDGTFEGRAVLLSTGSIAEVVITDSGSGFVTKPKVSAIGMGSGFEATVSLLATGSFSNILLDNPGQGYDNAPTISATGGGTGFEAEAILEDTGTIKNITIDIPGTNYAIGDDLTVEGDGSGAIIKVDEVTAAGAITKLIVFNKGTGYTYAKIDATAVGDKNARFTVSIGYKVGEIRLVNVGDGNYTTSAISVSGGSPEKDAIVSGVLSYGIGSVNIISGGYNYLSPQIEFDGSGTQPKTRAVVKYGVDYVIVDNAGTGYSDGALTFTSLDAGSGASANVKIFDGFSNVDEDNYKLALFGNGYVYDASGKWDFTHVNATDNNELVMIDSFDGNKTTDLGFAIGNNYRQDPCIFGKEWIAKVDTVENPIFDSNGLIEIEISYDYYMVAKDIVIMANIIGMQNSLGESMRLGEATKHTLRGAGLIAPVISFPKGVSNGIYTFLITLDETVEPLRNANFTYGLEVTGKDVSAYVLSTSNISECGRDSEGNVLEGRAYVSVVVSSPTEAGTIALSGLLIVKEFK